MPKSSESFSKSKYHSTYTVSQNHNQIKKNKTGSGLAFLHNTVKKGVHKWTFKLLKVNTMTPTMNIGVWKYNESINTKYCLHETELKGKCYGWTVNDQTLIYGDGDTEEKYGKEECVSGDIIEMILDLNKLQLKYTRNGQNYDIAYKNIQSTSYRAVISTHAPGDAIELISYSKMKTEDFDHDNLVDDDEKCGLCDELKDIAQKLKMDKDKLLKRVADLEDENERLRKEKVILKDERQTFRKQSSLSIKDKELLEIEFKELQHRAGSFEIDLMAKDVMIENLDAEIEALKQEKMKFMEIIEGQKEESKDLREELKEIKVKYEELRIKCIDESEYMQWDYQQVADWILSLDKEHKIYEESLRKNLKNESVDGTVLGVLNRNDLHRFGIESIKHKISIEDHIQRIKTLKGGKDERVISVSSIGNNDEGDGLVDDDTAYL